MSPRGISCARDENEVLLALAGAGPGLESVGDEFDSSSSSYVGADGRALIFGQTVALIKLNRITGVQQTILDDLPSVAVQSPDDPEAWLDATGPAEALNWRMAIYAWPSGLPVIAVPVAKAFRPRALVY